jgi:phosphoglycerate dehydrogenase-like enzyme
MLPTTQTKPQDSDLHGVALLDKGEIGFVGLGHMGTAMAANLAAGGHRVTAYVRARIRWTSSSRSV